MRLIVENMLAGDAVNQLKGNQKETKKELNYEIN